MLEGDKVILRPVRRADIQYFLKWFNDPEVTQYLATYLPMTEMAEEKWIDNLATKTNDAMFVIEAKEAGGSKAIGSTGLNAVSPKDHHAMFGIAIGEKDYWSKGYGTETCRLLVRYGFEQMNLHRINSGVISFNERSARMHRSVGFKEEGRQREGLYRNGRFYDLIYFGLLRSEWNVR